MRCIAILHTCNKEIYHNYALCMSQIMPILILLMLPYALHLYMCLKAPI